MRPRRDPSDELLALAAAQAYTLSRRQCLQHGLTDHILERLLSTQWSVITPGVYAVHRIPINWEARAWTGVLLGGETARLGGLAAAHVLGFADPPDLIQVWIDKPRLVPRPQIYFRHDGLGRRSTTDVLPRTTVEDTVLDLCEWASADRIAHWVASACNATATTADDIAARLAQRPGLAQRELIMDCVATARGGADSSLERRYVVDVEQPHGLPSARRQQRTNVSSRVDNLIEEYGVVVELDGRKGHLGTGAFRDMARDNRHMVQGLLPLRYGWDDVAGSPCETARQIALVLSQRGWPGPFSRCPRCENAPIFG